MRTQIKDDKHIRHQVLAKWPIWLPTPGNIIFTLLVIPFLVLANSAGANPFLSANLDESTILNTSNSTIAYQGYLLDSSGNPVANSLNMTFRFYEAPAGGTPLWSETHNNVPVNEGLFSVLLGGTSSIPPQLFAENVDLWLGITVGTDEEMIPRDKIASVPLAMSTTLSPIPSGAIIMWSGSIATIPEGWLLCDGNSGTPDLRNRFVVGAGDSYSVGSVGGSASVALTVSQLPSHAHTGSSGPAGAHTHTASSSTQNGPEFSQSSTHGGGDVYYGMGTIHYNNNQRLGTHSHTITVNGVGDHTHSISIGTTGDGQAHENRPPYYSLAYICKQ